MVIIIIENHDFIWFKHLLQFNFEKQILKCIFNTYYSIC